MSAKTRQLQEFYSQMLLIRRFEEASAKAYANGKIRGFCHLYIGEESVAVGAIAATNEKDYVVTTYRDHGHALARGLAPNAIMAELFGKIDGCSKGLGGSMHLFDAQKHFMGGHGIVGGHVALAAGIAFASQYKKERSVTMCFLGEGATNIGGFHEGMSLASLWHLPIVFIVENNLYAMGTPLYRSQHMVDISQKAVAYGMQKDRIDAGNVRDVFESVKKAVNRARGGDGPTLIETLTYRYRGHSMSDPAKYRTKEELESRRQKDPIKITEKELIDAGISNDELQNIDNECKKTAADSLEFAENSPQPPLSMLHQYTYMQPINP